MCTEAATLDAEEAPGRFIRLECLLKERGKTEAEADWTVGMVNVSLGLSLVATGLAMAWQRRWKPALALIAGGALSLCVGLRADANRAQCRR